jgi:hypothetical protein
MWRFKRLLVVLVPVAYAALWVAQRLAREGKQKRKLGRMLSVMSTMVLRRQRPRYASTAELFKRGADLFEHAAPPPALGEVSGTVVRDVVVIDNFYEDPDAVRAYALGLEYVEYSPRWHASALEVEDNALRGRGVRLASAALRGRLEQILRCTIDEDSWETAGDGWNGAFHYKTGGILKRFGSSIHNHVGRDADLRPGGWSGLVYLSPDPPAWSGTSLWLHRKTGRCWTTESKYQMNFDDFELVFESDNRYNRLVLFQGSVFHLAHDGFGSRLGNARLFQTFFFNVKTGGVSPSWSTGETPP